jgi:ankyrin repeat protein
MAGISRVNNKRPLLFYAIQHHQNHIVGYLLDMEEDNDVFVDFEGNTACMICVRYNNLEALRMYLNRHPSAVNVKSSSGVTAMMMCCEYEKDTSDLKYEIFKHKGDLTLQDNQGNTALH